MKTKDSVGTCPKCGKEIVNRKTFYGCNGYKEGYKFPIPGEFLTKKISEANAKKLLTGKKTGLIKGMKGKSDKEFDAYLKLDDSGRIEIEFAKKMSTNKKVIYYMGQKDCRVAPLYGGEI
ncbi:hypothetical protein IEQ_04904 [Bacillus cereus BAG6X1-2]|nr:hypothetical protein IEQ_04904 [Bacillus cereus BAG6X1-2]